MYNDFKVIWRQWVALFDTVLKFYVVTEFLYQFDTCRSVCIHVVQSFENISADAQAGNFE